MAAKIDPRNPIDAALIGEAKKTLKKWGPAPKLPLGHSKVTIVTFADGTTAECWQHAKWAQATNLMRAKGRNGETATVEHVVKDQGGRGAIVSRHGRFSVTCGAPGGAWTKIEA